MPKVKISDYSQTAASNTDINSINLGEGMLPSDVNNAIRELMKQLKDFQVGAQSDPMTIGGSFVASGGAILSGTNTMSGSNIISGNINSSGTNTFSGSQIISGNINSSGSTNTFSGNTIFSVNSSSDAVRITQTGAGNALVVEDEANPDSSPFVINADGRVISGTTAVLTAAESVVPRIATYNGQFGTFRYLNDAIGNIFIFNKSRGTGTTQTVVQNADSLGVLTFAGSDGTSFIPAARIQSEVDGTPGTNDMPGRLLFSTTADGASSPTERMRITNAGNALIGGTAVRGTTVGSAHLDIFNGTAPAGTLTNGISLYSSSGDFNFMDSSGNGYKVGYRNVPAVGTKTGSYTLAVGDVGKYVQVGSGGSITIPDATFAEGDVVSVFNNTAGNITITCTITTAYIAGTDTDKASVTLATRGLATILFISGTVCVISGNVT